MTTMMTTSQRKAHGPLKPTPLSLSRRRRSLVDDPQLPMMPNDRQPRGSFPGKGIDRHHVARPA